MVMNGANYEKDLAWLRENRSGSIEIIDRTAELAQLAIQGPQAEAILQKIADINLADIRFYWANWGCIAGTRMLISRTGYTGEDGFELYIPAQAALKVWDAVFAAGQDQSIEPIGLGARDTLRLEVKLCLYGNDIDRTTNPLEAGLGFVTKLDKPEGFIGSDALKRAKAEGLRRKLVGIETSGADIPRPHYGVSYRGTAVGSVTSGTMSPSLRTGIGMAYVAIDSAAIGTELEVDIRGRRAPATIVTTPFYKNGTWKTQTAAPRPRTA
jgi:aminomethyltransferase